MQGRTKMEFTYEELAVLNKIISNSLLSGEIEFNEVARSIHNKVANAISSFSTEGGE